MTSLLTHSVAHFIRPYLSLGPKIITSSLKVFKSCSQLSKNCQKWQNFDFQSQFSMSKIIPIYLKKISLKNMILGAHFLLLTFSKTSIFKPLYFLKWRLIFGNFNSTERRTKKLFKWLVVGFGPKGMPGRICDRHCALKMRSY